MSAGVYIYIYIYMMVYIIHIYVYIHAYMHICVYVCMCIICIHNNKNHGDCRLRITASVGQSEGNHNGRFYKYYIIIGVEK